MRLAEYLGCSGAVMLADEPFVGWPVERSYDEELRHHCYVFEDRGLELKSDEHDRITTIFLHADDPSGVVHELTDLPFASTRAQVLDRLGPPERSGGQRHDSLLGELGPWDRFARPGYTLHVEYRPGADAIKLITLMRADIVP